MPLPPRPDSSNDLLLEILREIVADRARDLNDGITPRALNRQLSEHTLADEGKHRALEERLRAVENKAAEQKGQIDTGRFQLPPPMLPPVAINLGGPRSRRPTSGFFTSAAKNPAVIAALIGGLSLLGHALLKLLVH